MESMIQTVATCELLIALGEEFGRNESVALKALLHSKALTLLEKCASCCCLICIIISTSESIGSDHP